MECRRSTDTSCSKGCARSDRQGAGKEFDVKGKVVSVDPDKQTVTLDHEDIPGLMKAMRMDFKVEDKKLLDGLKPGDEVRGRLKREESGYTLTRLEKR